MPDQTTRDAKLVQHLNEAYAIEHRLELSLEAQLEAVTRADFHKQLARHLKETKAHASDVEKRIRKLGGEAELVRGPEALSRGAEAAQGVVQRARSAVQKPLDTVLRVGEQERMLKLAREAYEGEAREIAAYRVIEGFAKAVGDKDTARLAARILREEQRMSDFLAGLLPALAADSAHDEVPVAEIDGPAARRTAADSRPARTRAAGSGSGSGAKRARGAKPAAKPRARSKATGAAKSKTRAQTASRGKTTASRSKATAKPRSSARSSRSS